MLRYTAMNNYQAFRWLWRHDGEAGWFWLWCYITGHNLVPCVEDNLYTYGVVKRG